MGTKFETWLDESVLDEDYCVVAVWHGTILPNKKDVREDFAGWMLETFGTRAKVVGQARTLPDKDGPGGRADLLFAIHKDDVMKFAPRRFAAGMRWLEDVVLNSGSLYTRKVQELTHADRKPANP